MKEIAITLDLETDYAGIVTPSYSAISTNNIEKILKILKKNNVKLSVFVQGKILEKKPKNVELFKKYGAEFHLHSFSHDYNLTKSKQEIAKGKESFFRYFKYHAEGYRFPECRITTAGLKNLEAAGFTFDSSFMPSLLRSPTSFVIKNKVFGSKKIQEIPLTVLFNTIPFSLSWMKILGLNYFLKLFYLHSLISNNKNLVFSFHMHDIFLPQSFVKLSPFWKIIYSVHKNQGESYLTSFLENLQKKGYKFRYISEFIKR